MPDRFTRPAMYHGKIEATPDVMSGHPVLAGTRILVRSVREFIEAGYDTPHIIHEYPSLVEADIELIRALMADWEKWERDWS